MEMNVTKTMVSQTKLNYFIALLLVHFIVIAAPLWLQVGPEPSMM
jgi:lipopolysaccharide export LptBFGC system permease protein LptF